MNRLAFVTFAWLPFASLSLALADHAADPEGLRSYLGTYALDQLMDEPPVKAELERIAGGRLAHLRRNLNVVGPVNFVAGWLAVAGNAPHGGTEEEAVLCVHPDGSAVHAALLSNRQITVLTAERDYVNLPLCIKDWITLANSGHRDRLRQPSNTRLAQPGEQGG